MGFLLAWFAHGYQVASGPFVESTIFPPLNCFCTSIKNHLGRFGCVCFWVIFSVSLICVFIFLLVLYVLIMVVTESYIAVILIKTLQINIFKNLGILYYFCFWNLSTFPTWFSKSHWIERTQNKSEGKGSNFITEKKCLITISWPFVL